MASKMLLAIGALPPLAATTSAFPDSSSSSSRLSFSRTQSLVGGQWPSLHSPAFSSPPPSHPIPTGTVYCGRGDKKTAKGKRFRHSFGNARPRNKNKGRGPPRLPAPPAPPKKDKFEDDEIIKIDIDDSLFS